MYRGRSEIHPAHPLTSFARQHSYMHLHTHKPHTYTQTHAELHTDNPFHLPVPIRLTGPSPGRTCTSLRHERRGPTCFSSFARVPRRSLSSSGRAGEAGSSGAGVQVGDTFFTNLRSITEPRRQRRRSCRGGPSSGSAWRESGREEDSRQRRRRTRDTTRGVFCSVGPSTGVVGHVSPVRPTQEPPFPL